MSSHWYRVIAQKNKENTLKFTIYVASNECILKSIHEYLNDNEYTPISIMILDTTCEGCRNDQPNQLAHMDPGGCLYDPSY